jgi:hypothetical protein
MSDNVFISYRRQNDSGIAGRIYDYLGRALPGASIFMDVDKLNPGEDFEQALGHSLAQCKVLLAVMGPQWASVADANGRIRLHDADDFVRKELRTALQSNVRVIPVLVNGAVMPSRSALPEDLHALTKRQAVEVRHERFNADVEELARAIAQSAPGARRGGRLPRAAALVAVAAIGIGAVAYAFIGRPLPTADDPVETKGCKPGFVWRNAIFGDNVCVSRSDHNETMAQNANASRNRSESGGAFGPQTCRTGYVWREAFSGDTVCVTPFERDKARKQNLDSARNSL